MVSSSDKRSTRLDYRWNKSKLSAQSFESSKQRQPVRVRNDKRVLVPWRRWPTGPRSRWSWGGTRGALWAPRTTRSRLRWRGSRAASRPPRSACCRARAPRLPAPSSSAPSTAMRTRLGGRAAPVGWRWGALWGHGDWGCGGGDGGGRCNE